MEQQFEDRTVKALALQLERIQQDQGIKRILVTRRNGSQPQDDWQPCAVFLEYPIQGMAKHLGSKREALADALMEFGDYLHHVPRYAAEERDGSLSFPWEDPWSKSNPLAGEALSSYFGKWRLCAPFVEVRDSGTLRRVITDA